MEKLVSSPEAIRFLHDGAVALAEVEAAGFRIDTGYLAEALDRTDRLIQAVEAELRADAVFKVWRKRYGDKANLGAPRQLAGVFFDELGYAPGVLTEKTEEGSSSEESFADIDHPFVKNYFKAQKLRKGRNTYLRGIQRELTERDGYSYVHPSYHLNRVATFRSSASWPNVQNVPVRLPLLAEMVRRCYIPRPGHQLLEVDLGQVEVRIPCPYTFDPVLIKYVTDPTKDMHRDLGSQLYLIAPGDVTKAARHAAKNQFVFPTFYGSYYAQCAPNLWDSVDRYALMVGETGVTLRHHLAAKGITELGDCDPDERPRPGTFEAHVKAIEDDFWGRRFKVYAAWKREWWEAYQRDHGFRMLTGFAVRPHMGKEGFLNRKQVCNYPIQGVAFHCLLWALIRVVRELRRLKMRTRVVAQVHDCMVLDAHPKERDDVAHLVTRYMTEEVGRAWPWLNVPLVATLEACPIGRSWFEKKSIDELRGEFLWT